MKINLIEFIAHKKQLAFSQKQKNRREIPWNSFVRLSYWVIYRPLLVWPCKPSAGFREIVTDIRYIILTRIRFHYGHLQEVYSAISMVNRHVKEN